MKKKKVKKNVTKQPRNLTAEPIRSLEDVQKIKKFLKDRPRDLFYFTLACNSGLRSADLVPLKVKHLSGLKPNEEIQIIESKTRRAANGGRNVLKMNRTVYKALQSYLKVVPLKPSDYLFPSKKGGHIKSTRVGVMIGEWCKAIGLEGNYSANTPRKTWGYINRKVYGVDLEVLMKRFKHSHPAITLRYAWIEDKEVSDALENEI